MHKREFLKDGNKFVFDFQLLLKDSKGKMSFLFLRNWEKLEERVEHIHLKSPIELTFAFQNKNIIEGILEPRKNICNDMSRQHVILF